VRIHYMIRGRELLQVSFPPGRVSARADAGTAQRGGWLPELGRSGRPSSAGRIACKGHDGTGGAVPAPHSAL